MKDEEASVHREMPCCEEGTLDTPDAVHVLPPVPVPVAVNELSAGTSLVPPAPVTHVITTSSHHEEPPLFLLNEQFLI